MTLKTNLDLTKVKTITLTYMRDAILDYLFEEEEKPTGLELTLSQYKGLLDIQVDGPLMTSFWGVPLIVNSKKVRDLLKK